MTTPILPPLDFSSFYNVIHGELAATATTRHGINPATEAPNPEVPVSTPADVEIAVSAAKTVFPLWAATPWDERRAAIKKYADALEREQEGFARLLVQEQGKPVSVDLFEIEVYLAHCVGSSILPATRSLTLSAGYAEFPI